MHVRQTITITQETNLRHEKMVRFHTRRLLRLDPASSQIWRFGAKIQIQYSCMNKEDKLGCTSDHNGGFRHDVSKPLMVTLAVK